MYRYFICLLLTKHSPSVSKINTLTFAKRCTFLRMSINVSNQANIISKNIEKWYIFSIIKFMRFRIYRQTEKYTFLRFFMHVNLIVKNYKGDMSPYERTVQSI